MLPDIAVVTANFGTFDRFHKIPDQDIPYKRYYFNEQNSPFPFDGLDNRMKARWFKIMAHRIIKHETIIWLDGNVKVNSKTMIREMAEGCKDILISKHPSRNSIYEEAEFVINQIAKGSKYLKSRYKADSMRKEIAHIGPGIQGLYYCGVFARKNSPKVNEAFERWWYENILWANFDQNSFAFCVQNFDLKVNLFDFGDFYRNKYYSLSDHR
jgi:hypothetical protein